MSTNEYAGLSAEQVDKAILHRLNDILHRTPQYSTFIARQRNLENALDLVDRIMTKDFKESLAEHEKTLDLVHELQKEKRVVQNFFNIGG